MSRNPSKLSCLSKSGRLHRGRQSWTLWENSIPPTVTDRGSFARVLCDTTLPHFCCTMYGLQCNAPIIHSPWNPAGLREVVGLSNVLAPRETPYMETDAMWQPLSKCMPVSSWNSGSIRVASHSVHTGLVNTVAYKDVNSRVANWWEDRCPTLST